MTTQVPSIKNLKLPVRNRIIIIIMKEKTNEKN